MSAPLILKLSNIISVGFNSNYSMTSSNWQQKDLIFDKVIGQVGNLLSLENGKIKIGKGIKKIKASFQGSTTNLGNDSFYALNLKKNGSSIMTYEGKKDGDPQSWTFVITPVIIDVEEGDEISISIFCDSVTFNAYFVQFLAEVIE